MENVKGAGVVTFNNLFTDSMTDTINVPVTSQDVSGNTYTVVFSNGQQLTIPCTMDGVLNIPFDKTADGVTFIIYGMTMDPTLAMQLAMQQAMTGTAVANTTDNVGIVNPGTLAMAGLTS